ncbi:hypothetical protein B0J13DRAFT_169181 [Dactylonectria estremocensis]|uniref:Uncharacterized protein n=1 Tax=Dactylonectria estremocensis TaxID=1079267 RepID=A0A9P9FBB7_9HYPO|nr:hypothetical protein B0J13DRAFT_169181 [Dactylonectria estremocensis]
MAALSSRLWGGRGHSPNQSAVSSPPLLAVCLLCRMTRNLARCPTPLTNFCLHKSQFDRPGGLTTTTRWPVLSRPCRIRKTTGMAKVRLRKRLRFTPLFRWLAHCSLVESRNPRNQTFRELDCFRAPFPQSMIPPSHGFKTNKLRVGALDW